MRSSASSATSPAAAKRRKRKRGPTANAGGGGDAKKKGKKPERKRRGAGKDTEKRGAKPESYDLTGIASARDQCKIISWNINGLRSAMEKHKEEVMEYLRREDADVICIQETKVNEGATDIVEKEFEDIGSSYKFYWSCCSAKKGYAGTLLMSKIEPVDVKTGDVLGIGDEEGRIVLAEFKKAVVVCTYVPNSGLGLHRLEYRTSEWDPNLREKIVTLSASKPVIWCGDLNVAHSDIDVADWKKKRNKVPGFCDAERENFGMVVGGDGNEITEEMRNKRTAAIGRPGKEGLGFIDVWQRLNTEKIGYTFWSYRFKAREKNKGWRLDYFVVSERLIKQIEDFLIRSQIWGPSDHVPIGLLLRKDALV